MRAAQVLVENAPKVPRRSRAKRVIDETIQHGFGRKVGFFDSLIRYFVALL